MRITVVTRNMGAGGAERVISQLLTCWQNQGVSCSLVCMHPDEIFYSLPSQIPCYEVPGFSSLGAVDKWKRYGYLRRLLQNGRPDVVLAMPEEIGVYVQAALLGTGIPVVVSERNNPWVMPDRKVTRLARRLMYPFVKGLIFQTSQAASFFSARQQKKSIVLPNPLDSSALPEAFFGGREKIVVSAGRFEKQKNFSLLIKAFGIFRETHPDYRLVIYGDGSLREELETLASRLLPEGSWDFPGKVRDLPARMGECGIFALSSDYEGLPNVLIEAMAVGTPVIATDCAPGGAAALIRNGENGLLVPVGDETALAQGLSYLADHRLEAREMARKAAQIRKKLDGAKVADQWLAYLKKCVEM